MIQKKVATISPEKESLMLITSLDKKKLPPFDFEFADSTQDMDFKKTLKSASDLEELESRFKVEEWSKKGKKLAAERIKQLEGEILELEKRRKSFDYLGNSNSRVLSLFLIYSMQHKFKNWETRLTAFY